MTAAYFGSSVLKAIYVFLSLFCVLAWQLIMVDFPPNLEDGEQWLPSDIYQEIISNNFTPKASVDNISQECATEIESIEHGGTGVLKIQNHLWPVHENGEELKDFLGNSGGSGVFLPRTNLTESKLTKRTGVPKLTKGTGVFLQSFSMNALFGMRKTEKGGRTKQGVKEMVVYKEETPEMKELSCEIGLPQEEWTCYNSFV